MQNHILAIDQGTTGSTALIFDTDLNVIAKKTVEFPQHFPQANWVEHNLDEIWKSVCNAVSGAMEENSVSPRSVVAIGITNQRETTCVWNRKTGEPFHHAIVWQDRRTTKECDLLKKQGLEKFIRNRTGLCLDPYFSATKLAWLLKHVGSLKEKAQSGELVAGTIDSFLLYRMSGIHATDPSNASRTLLMNIKSGGWDKDLLTLFKIPLSILPTIQPSCTIFGRTRGFLNFPDGLPISGIAGDQQAALFGQACFKRGEAKCTYGTGAFIITNTGYQPIFSKNKLLTTVAWKIGEKTTYGIEGSSFIAGASVQWLRDGLNLISNSSEIEKLASTVKDSDGVTFIPALTGMGAPHWIPTATGLISGLTRRTTKGHIARATLEGISFQVRDLLDAMKKDLGKNLSVIKVDGGASVNDLLIQFQSDILGIPIIRPIVTETTALGAGLQAALGVGIFSHLDDIEKRWKLKDSFKPRMKSSERTAKYERWNKALRALRLLAQIN